MHLSVELVLFIYRCEKSYFSHFKDIVFNLRLLTTFEDAFHCCITTNDDETVSINFIVPRYNL